MKLKHLLILLVFSANTMQAFSQVEVVRSSKDTSYISVANQRIQDMVKRGKPPKFTLQLSFNYNIGHMDLADNENTVFRKADFEAGANFGTRYGFGATLTGKIALHKRGNARLNISAGYNRFMSNFVISQTPEGKVGYNVFGFGLGIENNFSPDRRIKPYISFDLLTSIIYGNATLNTDSSEFNLKIKTAVRFGVSLNLGLEYAFNNNVGLNFGYKITHANIVGKQTKESSNLNETYLNDAKLSSGSAPIPYAGWKQFVYSSFYAGMNFYFGMKNKK